MATAEAPSADERQPKTLGALRAEIEKTLTDANSLDGLAFEWFFARIVSERENHYTLYAVAVPKDSELPALRVAIFERNRAEKDVAHEFEVELLPVATFNEDDAIDWHLAVQRMVSAFSDSYVYYQAKFWADQSFVVNGRPRGVGGALFDGKETKPSVLVCAVARVVRDYVTILKDNFSARKAEKQEYDFPTSDVVSKNWSKFRKFSVLKSLLPGAPKTFAKLLLENIQDDDAVLYLQQPETKQFKVEVPQLPSYLAWVPMKCEVTKRIMIEYAAWSKRNSYPNDYQMHVPRSARGLFRILKEARKNYISEPLILQALRGAHVPRPPVWMHRQAGRYLPEYLERKNNRNFLELVRDPELAAELTMQPVLRYGVDAAVLFSDIMAVPIGLGLEVLMQPGPFVPRPLLPCEFNNEGDKTRLEDLFWNKERVDWVYTALKIVARYQLSDSLGIVGFVGGPWTLLVYACGGKEVALQILKEHPVWAKGALCVFSEACAEHLVAQAEGGATILQVFESHAGDLCDKLFEEFAADPLANLVHTVASKCTHVPITVFARGASVKSIALMSNKAPIDCFSIDSDKNPSKVRYAVGPNVALQGNLNPLDILEPGQTVNNIRRRTRAMVNAFGRGGRHLYVANLGHGTTPQMSVCLVGAFVAEIRSLRFGTRASPLAVAQSEIVTRALLGSDYRPLKPYNGSSGDDDEIFGDFSRVPLPPGAHIAQTFAVKTHGDKNLERPLAQVGGKGLFTRELEQALLSSQVDIAQHSLKDMETKLPDGLVLAGILDRTFRHDMIVYRADDTSSDGKLFVIGTSAVRRTAQLLSAHSAWLSKNLTSGKMISVASVRGNLGTRLCRVRDKVVDAVVLAEAGLRRLGLLAECCDSAETVFAVEGGLRAIRIPGTLVACGQGAIGVQIKGGDRGLLRLVRKHENELTRAECEAERGLLRSISGGAGCSVPLACEAHARVDENSGGISLSISAALWRPRSNDNKKENLADPGAPQSDQFDAGNYVLAQASAASSVKEAVLQLNVGI